MKTNSCCLCRLVLFVGFFQHVKLMSTYTITVDSESDPFMTSTSPSEFTTVEGNKYADLEESLPTEIPPSDITTILMCATPAIILVLLIPLTVFIARRKRRKKPKEVPVIQLPNEDIKSPIFEEDTPSVMEIEMEDLDKWMSNMKKNSCRLSILEEENRHNTSLDS